MTAAEVAILRRRLAILLPGERAKPDLITLDHRAPPPRRRGPVPSVFIQERLHGSARNTPPTPPAQAPIAPADYCHIWAGRCAACLPSRANWCSASSTGIPGCRKRSAHALQLEDCTPSPAAFWAAAAPKNMRGESAWARGRRREPSAPSQRLLSGPASCQPPYRVAAGLTGMQFGGIHRRSACPRHAATAPGRPRRSWTAVGGDRRQVAE